MAREQRDFSLFQPYLEEMVALKREQADLLGYEGERYDALLEDYEPGMRTAQVEPMFAGLTGELSALLGEILAAPRCRPRRLPAGRLPDEDQMRFSQRLLPDLGFDLEAGQAGPFGSPVLDRDCRAAMCASPPGCTPHDPFPSVMGTIHEAGSRDVRAGDGSPPTRTCR